jgi:hypothetical protein
MAEDKAQSEPTLVEKWIRDQQDWQRTWAEYFDSMVKNDEFLVHLGNAMRGSLLAGKPYPGTEPPEAEEVPAAVYDDRLDEILHALHRLQGEVADLKMTVEDLSRRFSARVAAAAAPQKVTPQSVTAQPATPAANPSMPPQPAPGNPDRGDI